LLVGRLESFSDGIYPNHEGLSFWLSNIKTSACPAGISFGGPFNLTGF